MTHSGRKSSPKEAEKSAGSDMEDKTPLPTPSSSTSTARGGGERAYSPVAETLFRKDLISAMKLPDNEPLTADDYWTVTDTWKQDWEKGVQVPFKPEELPIPRVSRLSDPPSSANRFAFPKKLMCTSRSSSVYNSEVYQITPMVLRAEQVCSYDMDETDTRWLACLNGERSLGGLHSVSELEFESCMEHFERQCSEKIHSALKSNQEHSDEQEDSILCDVCRSPDSEECNEMVFCDKCNICVHQACYGITNIPSGQWLCRTCVLGARPKCELCPNKGGAMKCTNSGKKWAHVSCALWIPEVSIGCVEKMEPITKISLIPTSRWNLTCVLCKERVGCCIQCSIKTCKTAYHVTCAFKSGLEMRAIIVDENAEDGVKLRSYCQKHSRNQKRKDSEDSDSSDFKSGSSKKGSDEAQKLAKMCEFYKNVDVESTVKKTSIDEEIVDFIFRYWILKRRANGNKYLLCPRTEESELLSNHESEREKLKSFVHIRQDLERVRNLCYMVSRREKLQRSYVKLREQILEKQLNIVAHEDNSGLSLLEMSAILEANHGPNVYDRIFSHSEAEVHTENDFEVIISRISGEIAESCASVRKDNPYRDKFSSLFNSSKPSSRGGKAGREKDNSVYECIFSENSSCEIDDILSPSLGPSKKDSKKSHHHHASPKSKKTPGSKKSKKLLSSTAKSSGGGGGSSSKKSKTSKHQSDADLTDFSSSVDDDKLFNSISKKKTVLKTPPKTEALIYSSDSEEEDEGRRAPSPIFRTKAAMKDFSVDQVSRGRGATNSKEKSSLPPHKSSKSKSSSKKDRVRKPSTSPSSSESPSRAHRSVVKSEGTSSSSKTTKGFNSDSQKDYYPMIVPERAAARKASAKLKVGTTATSDAASKEKTVSSSSNISSFATPTTQQPLEDFDIISNNNSSSHLVKDPISTSSSSSPPKKHHHKHSSSSKKSDSSDVEIPKKSSSSSKSSDLFGFVPMRKAAKKANAYLKDSDRPLSVSQEAALLSAAASPPPKKSPGRPRKKDSSLLPPLASRLHSSSSSENEEEAPRAGKSSKSPHPRGPRSPRKTTKARKKEEKKKLSSGAMAFLSQRESQLDDFFRDVGLESKEEVQEETPVVDVKSSPPPEALPPPPASPPPPPSPLDDNSSSASSSSSADSSSESSDKEQPPKNEESSSVIRDSSRLNEQPPPPPSVLLDDESSSEDKNSIKAGSPAASPPSLPSPLKEEEEPAVSSPLKTETTTTHLVEEPKSKEDHEGEKEEVVVAEEPPPPRRRRSSSSRSCSSRSSSVVSVDKEQQQQEQETPIPAVEPISDESLDKSLSNNNGLLQSGSKEEPEEENSNSSSSSSQSSVSREEVIKEVVEYDVPAETLLPSKEPAAVTTSEETAPSEDKSKEQKIHTDEGYVSAEIAQTESGKRVANSSSSSNENAALETILERDSSSGENHSTLPEEEMPTAETPSIHVTPSPASLASSSIRVDESQHASVHSDKPESSAPNSEHLPNTPAHDEQEGQTPSFSFQAAAKRGQTQMHPHHTQQQMFQQQYSQHLQLQQQQVQSQTQQSQSQQSSSPYLHSKVHHHVHHEQPWGGLRDQDTINRQISLGMEAAQNEALFNYFYDYQRKLGSMPGYGSSSSQQQSQQYAAAHMQSMKNLYGPGAAAGQKYPDNFDIFNPLNYQQYHQQYMQQMGQYAASNPAAAGASGTAGGYQYSKKELEALDQIFSSSRAAMGSQSSSWFNQQNKMAMVMAQQYQQQQAQQSILPQQQQAQAAAAVTQQHLLSSQKALNAAAAAASSSSVSKAASAGASSLSSLPEGGSSSELSHSKVQTPPAPPTSQTRRISRDSPKRLAQSPRGGSAPHFQQGSSDLTTSGTTQALQQQTSSSVVVNHTTTPKAPETSHPPPTTSSSSSTGDSSAGIPSATLPEKLPGYTPSSKESQVKALKRLPNTTSSSSSSSNNEKVASSSSESKSKEDGFSISKELLDTVAAVSKLPAWKPNSERESESGASETTPATPVQISTFSPLQGATTPNSTSKEHLLVSERLRSRQASSDKTFEALVKRVESVKDIKSTPSQSAESREQSDFERNDDYDDTKGGVDYDDDDDFDDFQGGKALYSSGKTPRATAGSSSPNNNNNNAAKKSTSSKAKNTDIFGAPLTPSSAPRTPKPKRSLRGRGRGVYSSSRVRSKPVTIDAKALEKVHRTVAGTDYDFEDEFDDDFGMESSREFDQLSSLQSLREQRKKQQAAAPIYMQNKEESKSEDFEDFGDGDDEEEKPIVPVKRAPPGRKRGGGGKRGRGRGRGAKVAAPKRTTRKRRPKKELSEEEESVPPAAEEPPPPLSQPPLPKLKLGALMVTRKEAELPKVIPKLKIKLGPKPSPPPPPPPPAVDCPVSVAVVPPSDQEESVPSSASPPPQPPDDLLPPPPTAAAAVPSPPQEEVPPPPQEEEAVSEAPPEKKEQASKIPPEAVLPASSIPPAKKTSSSSSSSSIISPTKGSLIDSLAKKLLNNHPDAKAGSDSFFKPLDMTTRPEAAAAATPTPPPPITLPLPPDEQKSELDLLREELDSQRLANKPLAADKPLENSEERCAVPLATTTSVVSVSSPPRAPSEPAPLDSTHRLKHLKMKFRGIQPPAVVSSVPSVNNTSDSHTSSSIRPMRKKELLNRYYGQDIYPAPSNNGPASAESSSFSSLGGPPPPAAPPTVRNIIKMPKAVASVTSVPTRADYQPQLEANLERKRKRMSDMGGGFPGFPGEKNKGSKYEDKGSKKKRGRAPKEDTDYKPKFEASKISEEDKRENARKTRGKPPKKCLAESPPHPDPPENDLKAQHMIFAEKIRSSFDEMAHCDIEGGGKSTTGAGKSRRSKKRKKEEGPSAAAAPPAAKAPRIVIKFSKESSAAAALNNEGGEGKKPPGGVNGISSSDSYDFASNNDPSELRKFKQQQNTEKFPKIKIKI